MRAQLRPVEPPAGRDQHEQVVVVATAHDDRAQQGIERDALELGRLLGAGRTGGPDDPVRDAGDGDRPRRGRVGDRQIGVAHPGNAVPPLGDRT